MTDAWADAGKSALVEALIRYEKAAAEYRLQLDKNLGSRGESVGFHMAKENLKLEGDRMIACWRDLIHASMKEIPFNWHILHEIMNAMDGYLNRSKA